MDFTQFAATNMIGSVVDVRRHFPHSSPSLISSTPLNRHARSLTSLLQVQVISGAVYRGVLTAIATDNKLGVTLKKAYLTKETTSKGRCAVVVVVLSVSAMRTFEQSSFLFESRC
jgi:hypothetical protein